MLRDPYLIWPFLDCSPTWEREILERWWWILTKPVSCTHYSIPARRRCLELFLGDIVVLKVNKTCVAAGLPLKGEGGTKCSFVHFLILCLHFALNQLCLLLLNLEIWCGLMPWCTSLLNSSLNRHHSALAVGCKSTLGKFLAFIHVPWCSFA